MKLTDMETVACLKPGEPGTEDLVEQYGDDLYLVWVRYDAERDKLVRSAEIVLHREPSQQAARRRDRLRMSRTQRR